MGSCYSHLLKLVLDYEWNIRYIRISLYSANNDLGIEESTYQMAQPG